MNPTISAAAILHTDPATLTWVVVAVGIASLSLVRFSHFFEAGMPRMSNFPTRPLENTQKLWLGGILALWWSLDALEQARSYPMTLRLWHLTLAQALTTQSILTSWPRYLGPNSPAFWPCLFIAVDASFVVLLIWLYAHTPRWMACGMIGWGIIRWVLAGATTTWGRIHVFGPGSYLIAAAMAYLLIAPAHYRYILTSLSAWALADAVATSLSHPILVDAGGIIGFAFLAISAWRSAPSGVLRLAATAVAAEILVLASVHHALGAAPNQLWILMLLALAWGRHLRSQTTNVFERLGG
ncbi:MAG: hypothetical protein C7B45_11955 [Sulfobacillus acidophilus]|uniref:Uncharacterized protein n=1 Tax=Sulfobacillus acidophilus TaxID=53633 RepID=A0A2T2WFW3_9FIRM|nr:MAG: hypothetical protein C7B45_11955 [Sulfobacillus acidophilus]